MSPLLRKLTFILLLLCLPGCAPGQPQLLVPGPVHFRDVAGEVGLDFVHGAFRWEMSGDPVAMMGGGLCWLDFDKDGWLDLFVVNSYAVAEAGRWQSEGGGLPRSRLFRNGEGHFTGVSEAAGAALALRGNGCVAADFNLDGHTDIYITTERVNVLLWNNGDSTFSEGAAAAGVDAYGWHTAAVVGDLNQDGWPDIFVAGYVDLNNPLPGATQGFPNSHLGRRDLLYINNGPDATGRVTFREVGELVGLETADFAYGLGALLTDVDDDGDLDLYVANDTNPNYLYENVPLADDPQGIGFRLVETGATAQVNDSNSGMGVAGGDYDEDGRFDLFITNMGEQLNSVYHNQTAADPRFADASGSAGIDELGALWTGWGTSWGDFDLDSDLDLFVANGAIPVLDKTADAQLPQFFNNLTAQGQLGHFEERTTQAGLPQVGPLLARGSAIADYDNDGDLDIAVATIGQPLRLLQNDGPTGNWLAVQLVGESAGAVITAILPNGLTLQRELHTGSSYLSAEDPRCHLGLGAAPRIAELIIRWPDGGETRLQDVAVNQILVVEREP